MAWKFRRNVNLGLLRINVSKSGVGYSVGDHGFRVGRDAKGRRYSAASIPGTGVYRRDYAQKPIQKNQPIAKAPSQPPPPGGAIPSKMPIWPLYVLGALLLYLVIRSLS